MFISTRKVNGDLTSTSDRAKKLISKKQYQADRNDERLDPGRDSALPT
jgi:hypothetical protein